MKKYITILFFWVPNLVFGFGSAPTHEEVIESEKQVSQNSEAVFDYGSPNYRRCHTLYVHNANTSDAAEICEKKILLGFDFLGENFSTCYKYHINELMSQSSIEACYIYFPFDSDKKTFNYTSFDFTSNTFSRCYGIMHNDMTPVNAIKKCHTMIKNENLTFNQNIETCSNYMYKSYTSSQSLLNCHEILKSEEFNFQDKNFSNCFSFYFDRNSEGAAGSAVSKCMQKIKKNLVSQPTAHAIKTMVNTKDIEIKNKGNEPPETEFKAH